jgi:ABC-type branched-subunit amino acid transport system ATPase component
MAGEEWRRTQESGRSKLLVCRDIDVEYDGVQVLFGVDFDVERGETIALLGTNGAGKSTLLRAISGTQEASGGAVVFDGRDITHMPPHEVAQRGVIHMPGGRGVFPGLSVKDNLLLGAWMIDDDHEKKVRLAEVYEIFPVLKTRADTLAGSLSGGEQQQLSLAQAFLGNPRLLMIDELSLGLSPAVVAELLDKVREVRERGTTVIIVEQSVNVALTIAERAIFMEKGEVRFFGQTEELLRRPDILRAVYVKGTGALTEGPSAARRSTAEQRRLDLDRAAPALQVQGIVKRYGGVTALDGLSFDVAEGAVLGLIGPNGSGKTTLFDVVSGFQRADEGHVLYRGEDVTKLAPDERARRGLVRRFQDARLFPSLTTYETLLVALDQRLEVRNTVINAAALPQARRAERRLRARADRLIELLELGAYRDKFIKELSTGLRRIVDIACTLASDPKVLLLDEPSSGIAQSEAEGLAPLLRRVRHETGCTILIIEHDMPLLSRVADELIALESGQFLTRGSPAEVLNDDRVIESYLGTAEGAVQRSGGFDR